MRPTFDHATRICWAGWGLGADHDGTQGKMGIGAGALGLLARLRAKGLIRPGMSVVEIGAQQLADSFLGAMASVDGLGHVFGATQPWRVPLRPPAEITHGGAERLGAGAPLARDFWLWLGCSYASIDIDGSPGSIPLDLNFDQISEEMRGRFALVTNFGTTEHVANQLNAFKIIHDLAGVGGIMIHELPAQGYFNHGFFNYNPKFFWLLARSNAYDWIEMEYDHTDEPGGLPENILQSIRQPSDRIKSYRASDAGIRVALKKVYDIPFVPPINVQTGTKTNIESLNDRYWTVFNPQALLGLARTPTLPTPWYRSSWRRLYRWYTRYRGSK